MNKNTTLTILLIPICAAINIVGGQIALGLKLPIYLDVIGTVLAGVVAGPWIGGVTGLLSNIVNSVSDTMFMPFAVVAMAVGITAGLLSKKNMFSKAHRIVISVFIFAVISIIISAPIQAYVFGGITTSGSSIFTGLLLASGQNLMPSVVLSIAPFELLDKGISTVVSMLIVSRLPDRYLINLPLGKLYLKNKSGEN